MNHSTVQEQLEQRALKSDASSLRRQILANAQSEWSSGLAARPFRWTSLIPVAASVTILILCSVCNSWESTAMRTALPYRSTDTVAPSADPDLCEALGPIACNMLVVRQRIAAQERSKTLSIQITSYPIS